MNTLARLATGLVLLIVTPAVLIWMRRLESTYTVVKVGDDTLTVSNRMTLARTTYRVGDDARIVRDNRPAELGELQRGDRITFHPTTTRQAPSRPLFIVAESARPEGHGGSEHRKDFAEHSGPKSED